MTNAQKDERIKAVEHKLQQAQKELQELREAKVEAEGLLWKPHWLGSYYMAGQYEGPPIKVSFFNDTSDKAVINRHEVHSSAENVTMVDRLLQPLRYLAKLKVEQDVDFVPLWRDRDQYKYYFYYNHNANEVDISEDVRCENLGKVYFSEEAARRLLPEVQRAYDAGELEL